MGCLENQDVLIAGLGVSGFAAARLARHHGARVMVLDGGDNPTLRERAEQLVALGCRVALGDDLGHARLAKRCDLAVVSPGIPPESPLSRFCHEHALQVLGEFEFGARFIHCPILAITGTNGKTTTTELTTHCLRTAGLAAVAAGNIGMSMSELALAKPPDVVVAEISSFQIETLREFSPIAVALLNITPDHLDRYPDFETYAQTKLRLIDRLSSLTQLVMRADLAETPRVQHRWPDIQKQACLFSVDAHRTARFRLLDNGRLVKQSIDDGGGIVDILNRDELMVQGMHNVENALATAALCDMLAVPMSAVAEGLRTFQPSAHRLQLVGAWRGVRVINDSKSTNPDSLIRAVEAVSGADDRARVVLIAGGLGKNLNFVSARETVRRHVRKVFCLGESAERMAACWSDATDCQVVDSLEKAIDAAVEYAVSGDTVLLSPGCASQDMFTDYAERGKKFIERITWRLAK